MQDDDVESLSDWIEFHPERLGARVYRKRSFDERWSQMSYILGDDL